LIKEIYFGPLAYNFFLRADRFTHVFCPIPLSAQQKKIIENRMMGTEDLSIGAPVHGQITARNIVFPLGGLYINTHKKYCNL
jgi:hypothetical protein